jgi:diketogulonate reductase-like aldo/keto reductase
MLEDFPIGLGTFEILPDQIPTAISSAIRLGYKRIDCAPGTIF